MKLKWLAGFCAFLLLQNGVIAQRYGDIKLKPDNRVKEVKKTDTLVRKTEEKPTTYFQQEVHYKIRVKLDDVNHTLTGYEEIQYINNSPHTFRHLYFHLWANAYKNNKTALAKQFLEAGDVDFHYAEEKDRGFIDSLFFRVDGDSVGWKLDDEHIDICKIYLKDFLKPGDTITITTPFYVKLPSAEFSRLGHLNQSYFITQWYPKPAVYDKNGWNQMPYLNQGEFYSEYGSFDVSITVPQNYVVGATGDLYECPAEEKWLEQKNKETLEKFKNHTSKMGRITGGDTYPASSTTWKTLRYKQKNVHDFAWFADKRWNVLRGEITLPESGRLVTTWAMFTNGNSHLWKNSISYINDATKYYSEWNGEYPYNHVTAVDGTIAAGGGMEYPNITVIGDASSDIQLETVIMHEVGHNWFYGILGSNERYHAWMDEGINSFNEMRYMRTKYPELKMKDAAGFLPWFLTRMAGLDKFEHNELYYHGYLLCARQGIDQPIELPSQEYLPINYGTIVYMKTAASFDFLRAYLGEKVFDKCMHTYFEEWKFKHPQPSDIRRVFENVSKKNLDWFFEGVIGTDQPIDYKLVKTRTPNVKSTATFQWMTYEEGVVVKNKNGIAVPFVLQGIKADTIQQQRWYFGHDGTETVTFPNGNYDRIELDYLWDMPDINRKNHTLKYKEKGTVLFKRIEPLRLKFLGDLENPRRTTLYWTPVLGFNMYDRWMPGIALYNSIIPQKPFEFLVMPLFSTGTMDVAGHADVTFNFNTRDSRLLNNIRWTSSFDRYAYQTIDGTLYDSESHFMKVGTQVQFVLRNKKARSFHHHQVSLGGNYIVEDTTNNCQGDCEGLDLAYRQQESIYVNALYTYSNSNPINSWEGKLGVTAQKDFALLWTEANYHLRVNTKAPIANFRLFAGFFGFNNTISSRYNMRMDGQRGFHDYQFNQTFVGRYESTGIWSHQFANTYGGFKAPTAWGQSNSWLAAINADFRLPIPILRIFADAGVSDPGTEIQFLADAGFTLNFGICKIYFPLYVSKVIADEYEINGFKFNHRIRFTLHLQELNPLRAVKKAFDNI